MPRTTLLSLSAVSVLLCQSTTYAQKVTLGGVGVPNPMNPARVRGMITCTGLLANFPAQTVYLEAARNTAGSGFHRTGPSFTLTPANVSTGVAATIDLASGT